MSSFTCFSSCPPVCAAVSACTDSRIVDVIISRSSLFSFRCCSFISDNLFISACSRFAPSLLRTRCVVTLLILFLLAGLLGAGPSDAVDCVSLDDEYVDVDADVVVLDVES